MPKDIISPSEIALIIGTSADNIRKSYKNQEKKKSFYQVIVLGCYCIKNGLDVKKIVAIKEIIERCKDGK